MRIAFSTGSLYTYGMERACALAAEAGFDGIEVLIDARWDTRQADYLARLATDYVPIVSLHSPFALQVPGWEPGQLPMLQHTVDLAQEIGVDVVVTHLPMRWREAMIEFSEPPRHFRFPLFWPREPGYERWLRSSALGELEDRTGVRIGVENMPQSHWGPFRIDRTRGNTPDQMVHYRHLTMDTTHLGTWGLDVLGYYERFKERIVNIHLSNYDGREHRLPWAGELPLAEFVRRLHVDAYVGNLVVELHPDALGAQDEAMVRERMRRVVGFCHGDD